MEAAADNLVDSDMDEVFVATEPYPPPALGG